MLQGNLPMDLVKALDSFFSIKKIHANSKVKSVRYKRAALDVVRLITKYQQSKLILDKRRFIKSAVFIRRLRAMDPRASKFLTINRAVLLVDRCRSIPRRELMRVLRRPIVEKSKRGALTLMSDFMVSTFGEPATYSPLELTVFEMDSI